MLGMLLSKRWRGVAGEVMVLIIFRLLQVRYHRKQLVYYDETDDKEGYDERYGGESEGCEGLGCQCAAMPRWETRIVVAFI